MRSLHIPCPKSVRPSLVRPRVYVPFRQYNLPMPTLTDTSVGTDTDACIWSMVEVCVAIVCACLPTLKVLLNWILHGKRADSAAPDIISTSLARYPSLTLDERRLGYKSKDCDAQLDFMKVAGSDWAHVPPSR